MRAYTLTHLSDAVLLRDLAVLVAQDRTTTAALLAHIAEVDVRRLYLPAGYASMFAYCVGDLRLSEDAAYKRIQAARAARQFPLIFAAVADGRLHLTGLGMLVPHLTESNAGELLAAAAGKTKSEIEQLVAERFPGTEWLPLVQVIPASPQDVAGAPEDVTALTRELAPAQVETSVERPRVKPLSPERFALQFAIGKSTYDKLQYVQAMLSHRLASGDVAQVFDRALDALISQLEKQKFAATDKPRPHTHRPSANVRHIPAHVKRAVWQRDQGRCTFVGETGHRCQERKFLEFDHVDPVARGGEATVEGMRLRCRAHNQYEAECTFGAEFMEAKRTQAREAAEARALTAKEQARDVMAGLRQLGFRADEARRGAEFSETVHGATLEERMRYALKLLGRRAGSKIPPERGRWRSEERLCAGAQSMSAPG
jgi:5-methylcytosine-specific restriction endonuclease McrA